MSQELAEQLVEQLSNILLGHGKVYYYNQSVLKTEYLVQ